MANFHLNVTVISRGQGRSFAKAANYISGEKLHDGYLGETFYRQRSDVLHSEIYLPHNVPRSFLDLQFLCAEVDQSEKRYDARTAREFKCSLPNELSLQDQIGLTEEFIRTCFVAYGLCAIAAIHDGKNETCLDKNNPHAHIIVPTRTIDPTGFSKKKDREHDKNKYIRFWREQWAEVQNRAYERNKMDERVSHESNEVRGIDSEPTIHLSRIDWQKEKKGAPTFNGNRKRDIQKRNELERQRRINRYLELEHELSR